MSFLRVCGLLLAAPLALAQDLNPDTTSLGSYPVPTGVPYPNSTYPNATDSYTDAGAVFDETSPPYYPSPWGEGLGNWSDAYAKAAAFVSQLTLTEKVNLTTGVG